MAGPSSLSRLAFGMYLNYFVTSGATVWSISKARAVIGYESLIFLLALPLCTMQSVPVALATFILIGRPALL